MENIFDENSDDDYDREPSERNEPSSPRNTNLSQGSKFLPATLTASCLNTNFENSLLEINPCTGEAPLVRQGEKAKGERVDSELRTLLQNERKMPRVVVGTNLDEYEQNGELRRLLVGARPLHDGRKVDTNLGEYDLLGGGWEHQDGGGDLQRLFGPLHRIQDGPLHEKTTTSRQQGWEIST